MYLSLSSTLSNQSHVRNKIFQTPASSIRHAAISYSAEYMKPIIKSSKNGNSSKIERTDRFNLLQNIPSSVNYLGPLVDYVNVNESIKQSRANAKYKLPKIGDYRIPKYVRVKLTLGKKLHRNKGHNLFPKYKVFKPENDIKLQRKRDLYADNFMDETVYDNFCDDKVYDVNVNNIKVMNVKFKKISKNSKFTTSVQKQNTIDTSKYDYRKDILQNSDARNISNTLKNIYSNTNDHQLKTNQNVDNSYKPPAIILDSEINNTLHDIRIHPAIQKTSANHSSALKNIKAMINRYGPDRLPKIKFLNTKEKYIYDKHLFDDQIEPAAKQSIFLKRPEKKLQISDINPTKKKQKITPVRNLNSLQKRSIHTQVNLPTTRFPIKKFKPKQEWNMTTFINSVKNIMFTMYTNKYQFINKLKEIFGVEKSCDSVEDFPKLTHSDEILYKTIQQRDKTCNLQECDCSSIERESNNVHPTGIVNTRDDYYTIPDINELISFIDQTQQTCIVNDFTIGRKGFGKIEFQESIDVYNLNIDKYVEFSFKNIDVYPNDVDKPPIGEGLNKKAKVTLYGVWPTDKNTNESIKDEKNLELLNFETMLKLICEKRDFQFISYCSHTGCWEFLVNHF